MEQGMTDGLGPSAARARGLGGTGSAVLPELGRFSRFVHILDPEDWARCGGDGGYYIEVRTADGSVRRAELLLAYSDERSDGIFLFFTFGEVDGKGMESLSVCQAVEIVGRSREFTLVEPSGRDFRFAKRLLRRIVGRV